MWLVVVTECCHESLHLMGRRNGIARKAFRLNVWLSKALTRVLITVEKDPVVTKRIISPLMETEVRHYSYVWDRTVLRNV